MSRTFMTALVLTALVTACSSDRKPTESAPMAVGEIRVVNATTIEDSFSAIGTVRAETIATLTSRVAGNVTSVRVNEGDRVRRGDLLLTIDARDLTAQHTSALAGASEGESAVGVARGARDGAEANARLATVTYERYQALRTRSSVSPQEFDEVEARYRSAISDRDRATKAYEQAQSQRQMASAGVAVAATALSWSRITAPIDGVITARWIDPGAQAAPGLPLLAIESTDRYRVDASVDEEHAAAIRPGQSIAVTLRNGHDVVQGTVAHVSPAPDPATRSYLVKISIPPDRRLTSGLSVTVRVPIGQRMGISVPRTALVDRSDLKQVWIVEPGDVVRLRYVTIGVISGDSVEVLSGLASGERIVVDAHQPVTDGAHVAASIPTRARS